MARRLPHDCSHQPGRLKVLTGTRTWPLCRSLPPLASRSALLPASPPRSPQRSSQHLRSRQGGIRYCLRARWQTGASAIQCFELMRRSCSSVLSSRAKETACVISRSASNAGLQTMARGLRHATAASSRLTRSSQWLPGPALSSSRGVDPACRRPRALCCRRGRFPQRSTRRKLYIVLVENYRLAAHPVDTPEPFSQGVRRGRHPTTGKQRCSGRWLALGAQEALAHVATH